MPPRQDALPIHSCSEAAELRNEVVRLHKTPLLNKLETPDLKCSARGMLGCPHCLTAGLDVHRRKVGEWESYPGMTASTLFLNTLP